MCECGQTLWKECTQIKIGVTVFFLVWGRISIADATSKFTLIIELGVLFVGVFIHLWGYKSWSKNPTTAISIICTL